MNRLLLAFVLMGFAATAAAQASRSKPPTAAEKKKMAERAKTLDFWALCTEAGRALRKPRATSSGKYWDNLVITRAAIPQGDLRSIRDQRLSLGLDECSVVAILGKPDAVVRMNDAPVPSRQFVYRTRGIYVDTDNGVVRAWQD